MKEEGHNVPLLDSEPLLGNYEHFVMDSANKCESITDIVTWGKINMVQDLPDFVDLVIYCRRRMKEHARN